MKKVFAASFAALALISTGASAQGIILGTDANDNKVIVDSLYASGTQWRADGVFPNTSRPELTGRRANRPSAETTFGAGGALFERVPGFDGGSRGLRGNPGYESGSSKR